MKRIWRWMMFVGGCLIILILTTVVMINKLDCSGGLCDGPGYGIVVIMVNIALLIIFSIVYWIVVWRLNK